MKSTPDRPERIMLLTASPPAPPTPHTLMRGRSSFSRGPIACLSCSGVRDAVPCPSVARGPANEEAEHLAAPTLDAGPARPARHDVGLESRLSWLMIGFFRTQLRQGHSKTAHGQSGRFGSTPAKCYPDYAL